MGASPAPRTSATDRVERDRRPQPAPELTVRFIFLGRKPGLKVVSWFAGRATEPQLVPRQRIEAQLADPTLALGGMRTSHRGGPRRTFGEDDAPVADHRGRSQSASDKGYRNKTDAECDQGRKHPDRMRCKIAEDSAEHAANPHRKASSADRSTARPLQQKARA